MPSQFNLLRALLPHNTADQCSPLIIDLLQSYYSQQPYFILYICPHCWFGGFFCCCCFVKNKPQNQPATPNTLSCHLLCLSFLRVFKATGKVMFQPGQFLPIFPSHVLQWQNPLQCPQRLFNKLVNPLLGLTV